MDSIRVVLDIERADGPGDAPGAVPDLTRPASTAGTHRAPCRAGTGGLGPLPWFYVPVVDPSLSSG
jgi:hypothetical protein